MKAKKSAEAGTLYSWGGIRCSRMSGARKVLKGSNPNMKVHQTKLITSLC
jgi:hypothetical protein